MKPIRKQVGHETVSYVVTSTLFNLVQLIKPKLCDRGELYCYLCSLSICTSATFKTLFNYANLGSAWGHIYCSVS